MGLNRLSILFLGLSLVASSSFAKDTKDAYKQLDTFLVKHEVIPGGPDPDGQRAKLTKSLWEGGASADTAMTHVYAIYAHETGQAVDEKTRREFVTKSIEILQEQADKATAAAKSLDKDGRYGRMKESDAKSDEARIYFATQRIAKHCNLTIADLKKRFLK